MSNMNRVIVDIGCKLRKVFMVVENKIKKIMTTPKQKVHQDAMVYNIRRAKTDLEQSKNFFANVSDPDLVDYAAHKILANQSYYSYLLKKAKSEKITWK
ncbi:MAG: DUF2508 family protein [Eubacteriales bacterium]